MGGEEVTQLTPQWLRGSSQSFGKGGPEQQQRNGFSSSWNSTKPRHSSPVRHQSPRRNSSYNSSNGTGQPQRPRPHRPPHNDWTGPPSQRPYSPGHQGVEDLSVLFPKGPRRSTSGDWAEYQSPRTVPARPSFALIDGDRLPRTGGPDPDFFPSTGRGESARDWWKSVGNERPASAPLIVTEGGGSWHQQQTNRSSSTGNGGRLYSALVNRPIEPATPLINPINNGHTVLGSVWTSSTITAAPPLVSASSVEANGGNHEGNAVQQPAAAPVSAAAKLAASLAADKAKAAGAKDGDRYKSIDFIAKQAQLVPIAAKQGKDNKVRGSGRSVLTHGGKSLLLGSKSIVLPTASASITRTKSSTAGLEGSHMMVMSLKRKPQVKMPMAQTAGAPPTTAATTNHEATGNGMPQQQEEHHNPKVDESPSVSAWKTVGPSSAVSAAPVVGDEAGATPPRCPPNEKAHTALTADSTPLKVLALEDEFLETLGFICAEDVLN